MNWQAHNNSEDAPVTMTTAEYDALIATVSNAARSGADDELGKLANLGGMIGGVGIVLPLFYAGYQIRTNLNVDLSARGPDAVYKHQNLRAHFTGACPSSSKLARYFAITL